MPAATTDPDQKQQPVPGQPGLTDDLIRQIADKVYALLLQELRIEQERRRLPRRASGGA